MKKFLIRWLEVILFLTIIFLAKYRGDEQHLWAAIGIFSAGALIVAPVLYARYTKKKVRKVKPRYVEPGLFMGVLQVLLLLGFGFLIGATIIGVLEATTSFRLEPPSPAGDLIGGFVILSCVIGPFIIRQYYIETHYKRIVHWRSSEWKKLRIKR